MIRTWWGGLRAMITICLWKDGAFCASPPHKEFNCSCPMSKVGNPLDPLQMEDLRLYGNVQMSLCGAWYSPNSAACILTSTSALRWKGMCLFGGTVLALDNRVIHERFSPMNLQRHGNGLTGFGAGDLRAVINYFCRDSCTVRFSSHPAVADITESQPDTPSRVLIFSAWNPWSR